MILYTGLSAIIRADGSPKYSMICLVSGAILNLILDPIFIFVFKMGVAGGAIATVIGQIVSCIIAVAYLFRTKTIKLTKKDYLLDKSIFRTMSYGLSSFIIQLTVLALFITMNNVMTKFGIDFLRTFLMICFVNSFEMCTSILLQSLGSVKKSTFVAFLRQIILFIPLCLILANFTSLKLYGALYAGPIADIICFVIVIFLFKAEYKKIGKTQVQSNALIDDTSTNNILEDKVIIAISREYGSGGRYIGRMIADKLGIKFYDKDLVSLVAKQEGFSEEFIEENEQKKKFGSTFNSEYNEDDKLFIAETKVIKGIAEKESCVIIGRCADYILKDMPNVVKIFIYSSDEGKIDRAVKYYNVNEKEALDKINNQNRLRAKHYKYYTNQEWGKSENYDLTINSDYLGTEETAEMISNIIIKKYNTLKETWHL